MRHGFRVSSFRNLCKQFLPDTGQLCGRGRGSWRRCGPQVALRDRLGPRRLAGTKRQDVGRWELALLGETPFATLRRRRRMLGAGRPREGQP
jgi:hypothetical protein